jgi:hypothetical protein
MAVSMSFAYDDPNYTTVHEHVGQATATAAGVQHGLSFRTRVAAVVTAISVVLESAATASSILTLLFNGSAAALLTLSNSANDDYKNFTMTANRTLTSMTDRYEVSTDQDSGRVRVIYQYKIVPGATFSLAAALS